MYFDGIKEKDRIWVAGYGWKTVKRVAFGLFETEEHLIFNFDGVKQAPEYIYQTAFWSKPEFVPPHRPTKIAENNDTVRYKEALESIAKNSCCSGCQEAAKVAKNALGKKKVEKVIEVFLDYEFLVCSGVSKIYIAQNSKYHTFAKLIVEVEE
jgi:hypothetical protein